MSGETFNDASMMEIFRAEVETHVEALTSGLLALERDPQETGQIDEMMRGAHSIKGAARIVGIDPAVRVAHVMEDGFVAAQNGKLTLRSEHVDVLLRGVDLLNRIANASKEPIVDWSSFDREAKSLVVEIKASLAGEPSPIPKPSASAPIDNRMPLPETVTLAKAPLHQGVIVVPAVLDAAAAETVRLAYVSAWDAGIPLVRLDFSLTHDLDATGLALLAALPAQRTLGGPPVELTGLTADMRGVLEATGLDQTAQSGGT